MRSRVLTVIGIGLGFATMSYAAAPIAPRPVYGDWGFDRTGADLIVKPGADFFRYANGAWLDRTSIPADGSEVSVLSAMADRTELQLRALMEEGAAHADREPTTPEGKVGAFYQSFMDQARIEVLGDSAIAAQLEAVRRAGTHDDLAALMGRHRTDFDDGLFHIGIDVDLKHPDRYAVYLTQAGLLLPDRDYYLKPAFAQQKAAYQAYLAKLLTLVAWPRPADAARDIVAFERAVAVVSWDSVRQQDSAATYNSMSIAELQRIAPGFAWSRYLEAAQLVDREHVIVAEKTAFPKIAAIYARTPVATIQAWQAAHIADSAAFYLSEPFQDAYFGMHGKVLNGQMKQAARWKRGVHAVSGGDCSTGERLACFGNMSWAVGQLYAARYFPPGSKLAIEQLVANIKAAYRARIQALDWMGPVTKQAALHKLDTYTIKLGYPEHPRDYSRLVVRSDDLIGNVLRAADADWRFQVDRLDGPVDRTEWALSPQTCDADNGNLRDIMFPAAILQPPMFDPHADVAVNYGAIGAVIGHELTHGFDNEGRKIDADGVLRDWWTPADAKTFQARADQLGAQYSSYEPLPGMHFSGEQSMGENIADLGGLSMAVQAYHSSLRGQPAPVIDGLSGDQRLFLGWAQVWRGKQTDDAVRQQVVSESHPTYPFRVNGVVRNIDAWYQAFGVQPGEALYLAPRDRVHIW